jgi:hypothetical protein
MPGTLPANSACWAPPADFLSGVRKLPPANPSRYTGLASPYASVNLTAPTKALTGDISAAYLVAASNTKLRAHFGNAYRAPSLYERFGGGFSNNPVNGETVFTPYGDPRLSPDRYNSLDAGVDQYLFTNRVRLSATWFYTRVVSITAFDSAACPACHRPYAAHRDTSTVRVPARGGWAWRRVLSRRRRFRFVCLCQREYRS